MFSHNPLMGFLAGTLLTLLVQSSAATVGLTIALGYRASCPPRGIPIILGDNIGTTITAVLASIGTDRTAKQACAAHVLFNVIGVCIFLTILPLYQELIAMTATGIAHQIANAHTLFNVFNTIIFLPFVKPFAALIRRLLPDKAHKVVEGAQYLDPKLIEATPGIAVEAVKNECAYMGFWPSTFLIRFRKYSSTTRKTHPQDRRDRSQNRPTAQGRQSLCRRHHAGRDLR